MNRNQFYQKLDDSTRSLNSFATEMGSTATPEGMPLIEAWQVMNEVLKFQRATFRLERNLYKLQNPNANTAYIK